MAQMNFNLTIVGETPAIVSDILKHNHVFNSTVEATHYLNDVLNLFFESGYLLANIDTVCSDSLNFNAILSSGQLFFWSQLLPGNCNPLALRNSGWQPQDFNEHVFKNSELKYFFEKILEWYENNGYPFAAIALQNIVVADSSVAATIQIEKNQFITIDSLILHGNLVINKKYLYNYTGIDPGNVYCEKTLQQMDTRLEELPWCSIQKKPFVIFHDQVATIHVFADHRNANRFDFVLGFLPDNETGKLLVTGDGQLNLQNAFAHGETIHLQYNRFQTQTSTLTFKVNYPFLFSLPVGIDASVDLYKKDTSFINFKREIGIQYLFVGNNYFKVYNRTESSYLLSIDTDQIKLQHQLPAALDFSNNFFGTALHIENLDYKINPSKGWNVLLHAEVGERTIKKNGTVVSLTDINEPPFNFNSLYDSLKLKTSEYRVGFELQKFMAVSGPFVLMSSIHYSTIISDFVLPNEVSRLGGFSSVRGFDDESLLASSYAIGTVETRYLIDKNSFVFLFNDVAWIENKSIENQQAFFPDGFGAGITFQTKAGMFSVEYSLGSQHHNPIELRNAKIHFGYINYF